MKPTLVLIPGLGADAGFYEPQRRFFGDRLVVPPWIAPIDRDETIHDYGRRMGRLIRSLPDVGRPYFVGGTSLGGMIGGEVAEAFPDDVAGLFLISSCTRREQVRPVFRAATWLRQGLPYGLQKGVLNQIGPAAFAKIEGVTGRERDILMEVAFRTDTRIFDWAARAIRRWRSGAHPTCPVYLAHGRRDNVIPIREGDMTPGRDLVIPDGKHLISLTHAGEVNRWLSARMGD